jgi:hypothetical protein
MVYHLEQWLDEADAADRRRAQPCRNRVRGGRGHRIRWFTRPPKCRCAAMPLASAYVLFEVYGEQKARLDFRASPGR